MKDFKYYTTYETLFPNKSDYLYCECGEWIKETHKFCPQCGKKTEYEERIKMYKNHVRKYRNEEQQKHDEFKEDIFKEFDVLNNPKKDPLFDKVWDIGHSNGYYEVYVTFEDLVELIY